jgi:Putative NADPH-quinone reductase (modulator of drug activity B)
MTVILVFHPDLRRSRANRALLDAASKLAELEVVDMSALYPDGRIDVDVEVGRLIAAERLVLQFPVQWYSTPPLLKAWQDAVLTRMVTWRRRPRAPG